MIKVQGLEEYKLEEIQHIILIYINYLRENFHFEDLNFSIQDIVPFGSRIAGLAKVDSDLDVKVKYNGEAREDDLCNSLNDRKRKLKIENIKVDFYPEKVGMQASAFVRKANVM